MERLDSLKFVVIVRHRGSFELASNTCILRDILKSRIYISLQGWRREEEEYEIRETRSRSQEDSRKHVRCLQL
jgi:hypothetical protein